MQSLIPDTLYQFTSRSEIRSFIPSFSRFPAGRSVTSAINIQPLAILEIELTFINDSGSHVLKLLIVSREFFVKNINLPFLLEVPVSSEIYSRFRRVPEVCLNSLITGLENIFIVN